MGAYFVTLREEHIPRVVGENIWTEEIYIYRKMERAA
jgi:hypothetical protein